MSQEYCPRCQSVQNMEITELENTKKDENASEIIILTKSYHCSMCHMFVKSEDSVKPIS